MFCQECGEIVPSGPLDLRFHSHQIRGAAETKKLTRGRRLLSWSSRVLRVSRHTFR